MDTALQGKTAVITGATANIGRAVTLAFAGEGANVVVVGRDERQGPRVTELAIKQGAADAMWRRTDVLDHSEVEGLARDVLERFGAIDVLVNNVGGNVGIAPFVETGPDWWRSDIDLNLMSALSCTRVVLPGMIERRSGRIINIGSLSAVTGDHMLAVYAAAKGAVHAFTKALALEVGEFGITVNVIAPTATFPEDPVTDTSTGSRFHPEHGLAVQLMRSGRTDLGKMQRRGVLPRNTANPREIGAAAVFLASEQAAFITGELLCVDGGVRLT
jgi:2-hydroxycyclohexanecarboxyl-CoA dehydrogenase